MTHTYFSSFPSSLISLNYILILQWGTQEGVNIFHFGNFQRSFVSIYKGQNTKLLNERWEDFWHPREYKPALASLQTTSGTLSYVMFSCAIYAREKAQPTRRNVKKKILLRLFQWLPSTITSIFSSSAAQGKWCAIQDTSDYSHLH